jgi:transposase InsO family protein
LQKKAIAVAQTCRILDVSRSGYYSAQKRLKKPAQICLTSVHMKAIHACSGRTYGSRRIRETLKNQGIRIGIYRLRRLMKENNIRAVWKRKFVHTTDSKHDLPISGNILNRQFSQTQPNQAWVSDITYIRTNSGWLYLAAVMDLHSRKIVGWSTAAHMHAELVCQALQMAIIQRNPQAGLIVHSDRGSQYASALYQDLLNKYGLVCSMSRKGNCWDNAVMERFFLNLKMERVWRKTYANHAEAINDVANYIVTFYNSTRLHSSLGYLSPNIFEQQTEKQPILMSEIT